MGVQDCNQQLARALVSHGVHAKNKSKEGQTHYTGVSKKENFTFSNFSDKFSKDD